MLTPDQLLSALRRFDVEVVEHPGWRTRTSPGGWNPVGILHHWTAMSRRVSTSRQADVLMHGNGYVTGPLCHLAPDHWGKVHLIAVGNTNHAGTGDSRVLAQVRRGVYDGRLRGTVEDTDGNPHFWGLEYMWHPDDGDMSDAQVEAGARAAAAICWAEGWADPDPARAAGSNLDHGEWTDRKPDRMVDDLPDRTRRRVLELLTDRPTSKETPVDAVLLVHPTTGTPDTLAALNAMFDRHDQLLGLVCNPAAARRALKDGKRVYAIGGPACALVDGDRDLRGVARLDTSAKVLAQSERGW